MKTQQSSSIFCPARQMSVSILLALAATLMLFSGIYAEPEDADVTIYAAVAGNVSDFNSDGLGDQHSQLPGINPQLMSAVVNVANGPGIHRMQFEWSLANLNPDWQIESATVLLSTDKGTVDVLDTRFYHGNVDQDGLLADADYEAPALLIPNVVMPVTAGASTFSFDVTTLLRDDLAAGNSHFSVQGRVDESPAGSSQQVGLQVRTTASTNAVELHPQLLVTYAPEHCQLPTIVPDLRLKEIEETVTHWRYRLTVDNRTLFDDALFDPAPYLPPCGANANSSRTWVNIFDENHDRVYGFCAFGEAEQLDLLWFAVPKTATRPDSVYIELEDRACNRRYTSNAIEIGPYFPIPEEPLFGGKGLKLEPLESNNEVYAANATFSQPHLRTIMAPNEVQYIQFLTAGIEPFSNAPGQPDIPILRRLLAVPRDAEAHVVDVRTIVRQQVQGAIYPSQRQAADGPVGNNDDYPFNVAEHQDPPFIIDEEAYGGSDNFPQDIVQIRPIGRLRDLDVVQISVAAGQYNPREGVTQIFEHVEFEIGFRDGQAGFLPADRVDNPFERTTVLIGESVLNAEAVARWTYNFPQEHSCTGSEYLIITDPIFRPAADTLRASKISQGISTEIVETGSRVDQAGTTANEIQATIKERFDTCLVRPSYVLLFGDAEHIPPFYHRTCFADWAGTDLPFTTMEPDTSEPTADMAIGRIPVDTLAEANIVVNKIGNHDLQPSNLSSFYRSLTFASYFQCCRPDVPEDGTTSRGFIETAEMVRDHLLGEGYAVDRIYKTDTGYHSHPSEWSYYNSSVRSTVPTRYYNGALLPADLRTGSGFAWDGSTNDVVDAFNDERFLILHRGHGFWHGWGEPLFTSTSLPDLTDRFTPPVVYSVNCTSGLFDNETRIPAEDHFSYPTSSNESYWAERILRMEGGAVGVIGAVRASPSWANNALTRGLFDASWPSLLPADGGSTPIRRLGDILNYARTYLWTQRTVVEGPSQIGSTPATTDMYIYHVLGDPTMELWTNNPSTLQLPEYFKQISPIDPKYMHLIYPTEGATITLLQGGMPVARSLVASGIAELEFLGQFDPEKASTLAATMPGYIPMPLKEADATATATPEGGGQLTALGGALVVRFPPKTVDRPTRLMFERLERPSIAIDVTDWLDDAVTAGTHSHALAPTPIPLQIFKLVAYDEEGVSVTEFGGEYTIEASYLAEDLLANGLDENDLHCLYLNEEDIEWRRIETQVDVEQQTVVCSADHLTEFAIIGVERTSEKSLFLPIVVR